MALRINADGTVVELNQFKETYITDLQEALDAPIVPFFLGDQWLFVNGNALLFQGFGDIFNKVASDMSGLPIYNDCIVMNIDELSKEFFVNNKNVDQLLESTIKKTNMMVFVNRINSLTDYDIVEGDYNRYNLNNPPFEVGVTFEFFDSIILNNADMSKNVFLSNFIIFVDSNLKLYQIHQQERVEYLLMIYEWAVERDLEDSKLTAIINLINYFEEHDEHDRDAEIED